MKHNICLMIFLIFAFFLGVAQGRAEVVVSSDARFVERDDAASTSAPRTREGSVIGRIVKFHGEIFINGKPAKLGDEVRLNDELSVPTVGEAHVVFSDKSTIVVGARSKLKMESYMLREPYDAAGFISDAAVDALSTVYRAGKSDKKPDLSNVPTGILGVRN
jgi:hypothetical protein